MTALMLAALNRKSLGLPDLLLLLQLRGTSPGNVLVLRYPNYLIADALVALVEEEAHVSNFLNADARRVLEAAVAQDIHMLPIPSSRIVH
jgi:hypothetical protein